QNRKLMRLPVLRSRTRSTRQHAAFVEQALSPLLMRRRVAPARGSIRRPDVDGGAVPARSEAAAVRRKRQRLDVAHMPGHGGETLPGRDVPPFDRSIVATDGEPS